MDIILVVFVKIKNFSIGCPKPGVSPTLTQLGEIGSVNPSSQL
jgi:hypothetical protein